MAANLKTAPSRIEVNGDGHGGIEEIEFRSTQRFEDDLNSLSGEERKGIVDELNDKAQLLLNDRNEAKRTFRRSYRFTLKGGLESSLSELAVGADKAILLFVDFDPIFGQVILTLLRVVGLGERDAAYKELAKAAYGDQIVETLRLED